jgi:acetyl-CoA carboxylase biotin carboxyl carrier protein
VLTFEQMKELVELVARHRLSGLEVERSGFRFKIDGFQATAAPAPQAGTLAPAMPPGSASPAATATSGTAGRSGGPGDAAILAPTAAPLPGLPVHAGDLAPAPPGAAAKTATLPGFRHILNSPIVGTFYRAPSPDAPPFVELGSRVRKGQVLCIIEAMKLMNEIESDFDGIITEIFPQNAQAVEFGEPLFALEPN